MTLLPITETYQKAGTQQFKLQPLMKAFQYKDSIIKNKVYWIDSTAYPITPTNMTVTRKSWNKFVGGETIYSTSATAPAVGTRYPYVTLTASAINATASIDVGTWDMTNDRYAVVALRSTGTATAGSVKFRSSVGNEVVKDFTLSATSGTILNVVVDLQDATLYTGTPVLSAITEVEVQIDADTEDLDVALAYGVQNEMQIIGHTLDYIFECINGISQDGGLSISDIICRQLVSRRVGSGRVPTMTLTMKKSSLQALALSNGDVAGDSSVDHITVINSEDVSGRAISSGRITISTGQTIAFIKVNGTLYQATSTQEILAVNLEEGTYYYNSATGTIDFGGSVEGSIPEVAVVDSLTLPNFDVKGLELGYIGRLYITMETLDGRTITETSYKAQLEPATPALADDGDTIEVNVTMLPDEYRRFKNISIV